MTTIHFRPVSIGDRVNEAVYKELFGPLQAKMQSYGVWTTRLPKTLWEIFDRLSCLIRRGDKLSVTQAQVSLTTSEESLEGWYCFRPSR